MAVAKSVGVGDARPLGIAKHSRTTEAELGQSSGEALLRVASAPMELASDRDECHATARYGITADLDCETDLTKDEIEQLLAKLDEVFEVLYMREEGQLIRWLKR